MDLFQRSHSMDERELVASVDSLALKAGINNWRRK
jgi:hypothetical protein